MTDLEMTRLCAEAMGYVVGGTASANTSPIVLMVEMLKHPMLPRIQEPYDPLHDDTQAMALVKKFGLHIDTYPNGTWSVDGGWTPTEESKDKNLNRAIVECVAAYPQYSPQL